MRTLPFVIEDMSKPQPRPKVHGIVNIDQFAVSIQFDGFGGVNIDEASDLPVFVELRNGELSCYVMRNGRDKEPVKVVLSGARITK